MLEKSPELKTEDFSWVYSWVYQIREPIKKVPIHREPTFRTPH
jgi:hypothetical protein